MLIPAWKFTVKCLTQIPFQVHHQFARCLSQWQNWTKSTSTGSKHYGEKIQINPWKQQNCFRHGVTKPELHIKWRKDAKHLGKMINLFLWELKTWEQLLWHTGYGTQHTKTIPCHLKTGAKMRTMVHGHNWWTNHLTSILTLELNMLKLLTQSINVQNGTSQRNTT